MLSKEKEQQLNNNLFLLFSVKSPSVLHLCEDDLPQVCRADTCLKTLLRFPFSSGLNLKFFCFLVFTVVLLSLYLLGFQHLNQDDLPDPLARD